MRNVINTENALDRDDKIANNAKFVPTNLAVASVVLNNNNLNANDASLTIKSLLNTISLYARHFDLVVVPMRIESGVLVANLAAEQYDLTKKNNAIVSIQSDQLSVIDRVVDDFYNKGYTSLRDFQSKDYNIKKYEFYILHLKYFIYVLSFISVILGLFLYSLIPQPMAIIIINFALFSFFALFYIRYRYNKYRLRYEWDKVYFERPSTVGKKCST